MTTLQEKQVHFNSKLHISHTGGELSSDAGLVLIKEIMHKLDFANLAEKLVSFKDQRRYYQHSNVSLMEQLLLQKIAGYATDQVATSLRFDPIFKLLLDKPAIASQASISRFWQRFDEKSVASLQVLNQTLLDRGRLTTNQTELIIDVDSTHSDTFGNQESSDFNAHYQTNGFHPLVAFDGQNEAFLAAQLRPGNVYTSKEIRPFLKPLLQHYQNSLPCTEILVRGDSGFATPELYDTCEENKAFYLVRLKANRRLRDLAEGYVRIDDKQQWDQTEIHYYSAKYQAGSWNQPRQIYIKSTREVGELLFNHEYVLTNLTKLTPETAFELYQHRGQMENDIKEAKEGFFFDKTNSTGFIENHARMMLSVLAYNLVSLFKQLCLPPQHVSVRVGTLRLWLFKIAGKLVRSGRKLYLKLSSSHVYQKLFYQVLAKIQQLHW
ncbi:transposase DDE domain protein [Pediococcus damnosus]|uniref:IS1380 family transposase n=1 Tax=Pediococcus damnosus TaxID=51663 RepID=UPI0007054364|nr:IS1380 family transposase [Pediococcus damnosus]KRN43640.1 transposase DDE domain protein [Pediococcus damnosus]